jgi:lactoylglutathione lyase
LTAKFLHMCVGVSDLARAEAFYRELLGVEVRDRYSSTGWTVSFLRNDEAAMELELVVWEDGKMHYSPPGQDVHLGVCVEHLEDEHRRVSALAPRCEPIVDHLVNGRPFARYFFASDPDGNWIEFLERNSRYR